VALEQLSHFHFDQLAPLAGEGEPDGVLVAWRQDWTLEGLSLGKLRNVVLAPGESGTLQISTRDGVSPDQVVREIASAQRFEGRDFPRHLQAVTAQTLERVVSGCEPQEVVRKVANPSDRHSMTFACYEMVARYSITTELLAERTQAVTLVDWPLNDPRLEELAVARFGNQVALPVRPVGAEVLAAFAEEDSATQELMLPRREVAVETLLDG
jgi:hypothetical protein